MAAAPTSKSNKPNNNKSIPDTLSELKDLTVSYAKQETVDPLKGVGRYLAYGVAGSLLLGLGVVLLMLAGLRALQTETGSTFTGNLSWVPYLIVLVGGAALIALALTRIAKKK